MDKQKSGFIDFIPEGEEKGSPFGKGGYQDYVPAEPVVEITQELVEETPKKKGKK